VDAVSSNIFWIEGEKFLSPPSSDGGVEGVMRKNLISLLSENKFSFSEKSINAEALKSADEIFLTNIGWCIKSVTKFEGRIFKTETTKQVFNLVMKSLRG